MFLKVIFQNLFVACVAILPESERAVEGKDRT